MIQIISNNTINVVSDNIEKNRINDFNSFDEYDLNIINISDFDIWRNVGGDTINICNKNDLLSLSEEIIKCDQNVLILLPQNIQFKAHCNSSKPVFYRIKDIIDNVLLIINSSLYNIGYNISYGTSKTKINGINCKADFYFNDVYEEEISTTTELGSRITTIKRNNVWITTLNLLESIDCLNSFINNIIFPIEKEFAPDWLKDVEYYNDKELLTKKEKLIEDRNKIDKKINDINKSIGKNNHFKSILYTTGDELKEVVYEILEEILNYDLSSFKDNHEEDCLISFDDVTFACEIKGISTNIKRENVNQANNHVVVYLDKLEEEKKKEKVKGLLIINHQRTTPLLDRYNVSSNVIDLAKINKILIIQTIDLLNIYEKYLKKEISTKDIIKIFNMKIGLLDN